MEGREDAAAFAVEFKFRAVVAYRIDDFAGGSAQVDVGVGFNFAGDDYLAGGDKGLAGDLGIGVLGEELVENGVGNLVSDFVGVAFGNGFRCEKIVHGFLAFFLVVASNQIYPQGGARLSRGRRSGPPDGARYVKDLLSGIAVYRKVTAKVRIFSGLRKQIPGRDGFRGRMTARWGRGEGGGAHGEVRLWADHRTGSAGSFLGGGREGAGGGEGTGGSEGVADGEVEGEGVLEGGEVEVAALAGVVGGVEADAEVGAENEHGYVETEADAGAEGDVLQEG